MSQHQEPTELEILEFGHPSDVGRGDVIRWSGSRRWRWLGRGLLAAVTVAALVHEGVGSNTAPAAQPHPPASTAGRPELVLPATGGTSGWELIGQGAGVMVRIGLATGTPVVVRLPAWPGTEPVALVAGHDEVLLDEINAARGYAVFANGSIHQLPETITGADVVLPGPEPDQVWVTRNDDRRPIRLVRLDGLLTGVDIPSPGANSVSSITSDGGGYLLFDHRDWIYQARPDGLHLVTTGSVVATGATGWLTRECHGALCETIFVDRATGARSTIDVALPVGSSPGAIAPDGRHVAIRGVDANGTAGVFSVDLESGAGHEVAPSPTGGGLHDVATWSPDGHYLFSLDAQGAVVVFDTYLATTYSLGLKLPRLAQIALRSQSWR